MSAPKDIAMERDTLGSKAIISDDETKPESSSSSSCTAQGICDSVEKMPISELLPWFRRRLFWKKYIFSLLITFLIGMTFALIMEIILPEEGQWSDMRSHTCDEYCENSHMCDHTMKERPTVQQPVNAYSNLAYIWCGIVPLIFLRVDLSTIMYFLASSLLAISSFMFHASISKLWMQMDGASMYTYGSVLIFHGLHCVLNVSWKFLALLQVALLIIIPIVRPKITIESELINSGQLIAVVILAVTLVLARLYRIINLGIARATREHLSCCAAFFSILGQSVRVIIIAFVPAILSGIATFVWMKDMNKDWCDPDSKMQWHGVWHCFTGFSSLWLWVFVDMNKLKDTLASSGQDLIANTKDTMTNTKYSIRSTEIFNPLSEEDANQDGLISDVSSNSLIQPSSSMA
jgi:hypothetical protein